jgi:hypothetical protein
MTKRRATVTGWDPAYVNPNSTTGRPKGVQTAIDARIAMTYDVAAEGIFAKYGVPAITGSPTNSASISPFQAAIASPNGGFYVVTIDAAEAFSITMANVGAVKIYVQQEDYEVDNTKVNSAVNIGVVYGATAIPANSLLLFTTTITAQTSTNGLTFTPAFKYTGAASGVIRVPTQADLANIATSLVQAGLRALVQTTGGGGTRGEYFYTGSTWQITTTANPSIDSLVNTGWLPVSDTWSFSSWNATTKIGVITVPSNATLKYSAGQWIRITQATGGTKIGFIMAVTTTTLTVNFFNLYTLTNETITSPQFSFEGQPYNAPALPVTYIDANAWRVIDHGAFKEWWRKEDFSVSVAGGNRSGGQSVPNPVGITDLNNGTVRMTLGINVGFAAHATFGMQGNSLFIGSQYGSGALTFTGSVHIHVILQ